MSDNGTQFKSAWFEVFTAKYGFRHTTTSPHHQQANGAAESGVRISKRILKREDPFLALMVYCATPISATEKTPSELIMGRQIQIVLKFTCQFRTWPTRFQSSHRNFPSLLTV